ncbi:MAG: class I SAM-dependent methyltransferase [Planctomycetes bacterium]|nr:class I SAM-dependent methyltransferase [Planctomycetota bacterium]
MSEPPAYARYYDFVADFDHDVGFYRDLALAAGGAVLELGCGNGRVAIPLARAGARVTGLDRSPEMLAAARAKEAAVGSAGLVEWLQADMLRPALGKSFSLVYAAANTLLVLSSVTAQKEALAAARSLVAPDGRLALDVFHPPVYLRDHPPDGRPRVMRQGLLPGGCERARWTVAVRHSAAAQILVAANEIEIYRESGAVERHAFEETLRYCHRFELELLLERAGFEIETLHGWFDRRPFDDSARKMVVVARPA